MRISNSMMSANVLSWLQQAQERMFSAQVQAASGRRLLQPSDDPSAAARVALLHTESARQEQYLADLETANFWLSASESSLGDLTDIVRSLRDLAVEAAGQSQDATQREALASQVRSLQEQLVDVANTRINGRYLFAGQATSTEPIDVSGGVPPAYAGAAAPPTIDVTPNTTIAVGATAVRVLNSGGAVSGSHDDLISTCASLADLIEVGDADAVSQLLDDFDFHLSNVLEIRGEMGASLQTCASISARLEAEKDAVTGAVSNLEDADLSEVLTNLAEHQYAYQAAAGIAASLHSVSLLDFLR